MRVSHICLIIPSVPMTLAGRAVGIKRRASIGAAIKQHTVLGVAIKRRATIGVGIKRRVTIRVDWFGPSIYDWLLVWYTPRLRKHPRPYRRSTGTNSVSQRVL